MKVAISSSSFDSAIASGQLTQLEWLERAAREFGADGVVFDDEHFPRSDAEYLAQLKKIAVDCGLVPLALRANALFDASAPESAPQATIERASALGALFIITRLPAPGEVPPATFVAAVTAAKSALKTAKRLNITILLAPTEGTLAPDLAGVRHFLNDVDSAWLRYAIPASASRDALGTRDRVLAVLVDPNDDVRLLDDLADDARPWFVLEGALDAARMRIVRGAAAKKTLAEANAF